MRDKRSKTGREAARGREVREAETIERVSRTNNAAEPQRLLLPRSRAFKTKSAKVRVTTVAATTKVLIWGTRVNKQDGSRVPEHVWPLLALEMMSL
jgi:hypothetical protein